MPVNVPRILVIDDNEEEGIQIAKSVWNSKYAIRFIHYDQEQLITAGKENMRGVRIIFMDIDLIGEGIKGSGSKNFAVVEQVLQYCLDERNGPYVLITWSTFDTCAPELFEHLNERMPPSLKPSLYKQLNKEEYKDGSGNLTEKIKEYILELDAIGALISWEKSIESAASETLCEMIDIASRSEIEDKKDALRGVLYGLAHAEAEQNLDNVNAVKHLYSVISNILYDNLADVRIEGEAALSELVYSGKDLIPKKPWSQKINTMLHLDLTNPQDGIGHTPGDVFIYPTKGHGLPIPDEDTGKFLRGRFMTLKRKECEKEYKERIVRACNLLMIEITPPCDYSQNKFVWHRYVVGARVPLEFCHLLNVLNRETEERDSRLPDFCWRSPEFQINEDKPFNVIFNSRLIVSIPKKPEFLEKVGRRIFRIRQPLLSDMMGWLSRQVSRQGHVSVT